MTWRENLSLPRPTLSGTQSVAMDLSSFSELLRRQAPELLPVNRVADGAINPTNAVPHGTTIVAIKYPGGVLIELVEPASDTDH